MNTTKPVLLFYCQHSLGMGHLVRALTLAHKFVECFHVVFLNGGRFPEHLTPSADIEIINLPPIGMAEDNQLYSQDEQCSLLEAQALRREMILTAFEHYQPDVILIELFPFGRKKFAGELLPLLKSAKRRIENRPLVLCSLRDIMVGARKDQSRHDDRARWLVDRYFNGVLVHSDPKFASLEESFKPSRLLKTPVFYTGFVLPGNTIQTKGVRQRRVLVSAGGGMVGAPLFHVALKAQPLLWSKLNLPMTLVAGPFLPEEDWLDLKAQAVGCPGLTLQRSVSDMSLLLATHSVSVSQCGYNTVMDILKSGIAALVVPFALGQEDEQSNRAQRLSKLGLLRKVEANHLSVERFVAEVEGLLTFNPGKSALDLDGTANTIDIIHELLLAKKSLSNPCLLDSSDISRTAYV
jgi:predicted glycosyltransferase